MQPLIADNISVIPEFIDMVAGGEPMDSVPARRERDEHPNCNRGAFTIQVRYRRDYYSEFDFCDNSMREKDWRCHARGKPGL
jgi:hypothetical protein